ncbi:MAG: Acetyltransferase (GNAT) family protein [Syntrophus sp. PtaB.Bin138]|nr:MAG: Acetyltransferase (GNAT) family protein [Syntrophus sp. PtaB.Bin138]
MIGTTHSMNKILEQYETKEYFFSFYSPEFLNGEKIVSFLKKVDEDFNPRLTVIHDLSEYAEKIIKRADAIYAINKGDLEVCGMNVFYLRNRDSEYCYGSLLAISPDFRGKGLSKKLTEALISYCKTEPIKGVLCKIWSTNVKSLKMHTSLGFEIYGTEERNSSDDHTLLLKLLF